MMSINVTGIDQIAIGTNNDLNFPNKFSLNEYFFTENPNKYPLIIINKGIWKL